MSVLKQIVEGVDDVVTRGARLTRTSLPVTESPEQLANQASQVVGRPVSVEEYTIARVIRSERATGGPTLEAVIIGWIARNVMAASGIRRLIGDDGLYGKQGGSAWFATSRDPYEGDLIIATAVLAGAIPDPTGGAKNFVHPKGFPSESDYLAVREKWISKGLTPKSFEAAPGIEVYS